MKFLFVLLFLKFNQTYFDAVFSIERQSFDHAISKIYTQLKTSPDSTLCDLAITHSAAKISSLDFQTFVNNLRELEKGLKYIDSIFNLYQKYYTVYDTLFFNYLKISLFIKKNTQIEKELNKWLKEYGENYTLLDILLHYAIKYNVNNIVNKIISDRTHKLNYFSTNTLLLLAQELYNKNEYQSLGRILQTISKRALQGKNRMEFLKFKGIYFEYVNNLDSALFYLNQYLESETEVDMGIFQHLLSIYTKKGDYNSAKKIALNLLNHSPFNYKLRKQLGYIYFMLQEYDSSLLNYFIAKSLVNNDPDIDYYISRVLIRKNLLKDALNSIINAERSRRHYSYSLLKAFILLKLHYVDDAARELLVWKQKGKNDPYYLYLSGLVLKEMGKRKLSFSYLKKSIEMDPTHPRRYIPLLSLSTSFADTHFIRTIVDTVRKLKLHKKDDIFDLAFAAQVIKDTTLADSLYRLLISKYPNNALYYNNLGYMWLVNGNLEKAEGFILKAYEIDPNDPYILDSYSWLLFKKGEIEKAYIFIKKAIKKESRDREIKNHYKIIKSIINKNAKQ